MKREITLVFVCAVSGCLGGGALPDGHGHHHGSDHDHDSQFPMIGAAVGTPYPYEVDVARDPGDVPPEVLAEDAVATIAVMETDAWVGPALDGEWAGGGADVRMRVYALGGGHPGADSTPRVPGPMLRLAPGRPATVRLDNSRASETHSLDFHAIIGGRGGASTLTAGPGETVQLTFTADIPGVYVYHCAGSGTPHTMAHHMNNGMFGLVLVEPTEGELADLIAAGAEERYVFQHDVFLDRHTADFDANAMRDGAMPTYSIYNGRVGALFDRPVQATVGRDVIIYHGALGAHVPSVHVVGEIFDWVWEAGDVQSSPARGVQTAVVPAGGAIAVGLAGDRLIRTNADAGDVNVIVDHATPFMLRGAMGMLEVR